MRTRAAHLRPTPAPSRLYERMTADTPSADTARPAARPGQHSRTPQSQSHDARHGRYQPPCDRTALPALYWPLVRQAERRAGATRTPRRTQSIPPPASLDNMPPTPPPPRAKPPPSPTTTRSALRIAAASRRCEAIDSPSPVPALAPRRSVPASCWRRHYRGSCGPAHGRSRRQRLATCAR